LRPDAAVGRPPTSRLDRTVSGEPAVRRWSNIDSVIAKLKPWRRDVARQPSTTIHRIAAAPACSRVTTTSQAVPAEWLVCSRRPGSSFNVAVAAAAAAATAASVHKMPTAGRCSRGVSISNSAKVNRIHAIYRRLSISHPELQRCGRYKRYRIRTLYITSHKNSTPLLLQ